MHSPEHFSPSPVLSRRTAVIGLAASVAATCANVFAKEPETIPEYVPLRFDGEKAHGRVEDFFYEGQHPLTIEATVYPDSIDRTQTILGNLHSGGFGLTLEGGYWNFVCHNGEQYLKSRSDKPAKPSEEASLVAVCDGRLMRLYVNGVLQKDMPKWHGKHKASRQPLLIGADPDGSGKPQHCFAGTLQNIRLSALPIDLQKRWQQLDRTKVRADHLLLIDGESGTDHTIVDRSRAARTVTFQD